MAFEPITTQEQFDTAITERLRREREKLEKQYADYAELKEKAGKTEDLEKQIAQLSSQLEKSKTDLEAANAKISGLPEQIETLSGRAKSAERELLQIKIAHDAGLPFELANRISGETEEEMRTDAEKFAPFVNGSNGSAPLFNGEKTGDNSPFTKLLNQMKG